MGVLLHDALTHHVVGVLLQPSLSSAHLYQSSRCRASAFVLKTLPESRIMVGFGNNGFTGMESGVSLRGTSDSKVTNAYINSYDLLLCLWCGTLSLDLKPTRCATSCTQASDENVLGSGLDRWMSI